MLGMTGAAVVLSFIITWNDPGGGSQPHQTAQPQQPEQMLYWAWLLRSPFPIFGALLGASLWYVARRLYGNAGGDYVLPEGHGPAGLIYR